MFKQKTVTKRRCFKCNKFKWCYVFFVEDVFSMHLYIADGYLCISCFERVKRRILHMEM